jgi:predicted SAM-dependent methyltransferase
MLKVNMMCGKRNWGPDWVHIDGADYDHIWHPGIKLYIFPPGTVDYLYCSHGLAYFSLDEARELLKLWYEVMAPGAMLRIATPDLKALTKLYQSGVEWERIKGPLYGEMELNEKKIYHKMCYEFRTLAELLEYSGFMGAERYDHMETEHPNTGDRDDFYDDHSAAYIDDVLISLNMQCVKP